MTRIYLAVHYSSVNLRTDNLSHCGWATGGAARLLGTRSVVKLLDEHERTMAFAEVALGQIRSLRQTAVPRNYEIWYVYATGYNAPSTRSSTRRWHATAR